jgi:YbbR domain-containing protein
LNIRTLLAKSAENWPAKALSIALALGLFAIHRMSILEERSFLSPLLIELEPNIVAASHYPSAVQVTIRGDAEHIRSLTEESIETYIDLRGKGRGKYRAPVHFRKKGAAQSAEPLEIKVEPLEISLILDNKVSKYVPIKADIQGTVKQGYELAGFTLNPAQAVIDGPSDLMTGIAELSTEVIELENRNEDFSIMVMILQEYPFITIRGTAMTEFRGSIKEIIGLENFSGIPIKPQGLPEQFKADIDIKTGTVRLGGTPQELERFNPPENFLTVDCSGIAQPGVYTLPVSVLVPPELTRLRQEPETVTVRIAQKK